MTKQEVIDKLKAAILDPALDDYQRVEEIALSYALGLVEELDETLRPPEPKPLEIEKPVVPQSVADWYEEHKDNFEFSVQCLCVHGCEPVRKIDAWFDSDNTRPIETLVMMHKFGYEIEREKLYTVEIPNPNGGEYSRVYLGKYSSGKVGLYSWTDSTSIKFDNNWKQEEKAQLTEAEIKEDFAWAWKWAKEVEE